jgi:hypothetical protein
MHAAHREKRCICGKTVARCPFPQIAEHRRYGASFTVTGLINLDRSIYRTRPFATFWCVVAGAGACKNANPAGSL